MKHEELTGEIIHIFYETEADERQMLNYLSATDIEVGLLLNFGPKAEKKRKIFDNDRKPRFRNK